MSSLVDVRSAGVALRDARAALEASEEARAVEAAEAALRVAVTSALEGHTGADVAAAAGVSRALIYRKYRAP